VSSAASPSLDVIVVTYEWPEALELVLAALAEQHDSSFGVVVADDGSRGATAHVVDSWRKTYGDRLRHVWQPDEGWQKSRILNLATLQAEGEYLAFIDGDVIPRRSFVGAVRRAALAGWFLATKRVLLSERFTARVLADRLPIWRWSSAHWLLREPREARRPGYFLTLRDRRRPWKPGLPDFAPPDRAHGFFFGVSRGDLERVNGWDSRFRGWACEDTDLAIRLGRVGLRCGWPGPDATMFHLWHPGGKEHVNEPLLFETQASDRVEAVVGLRELTGEPVVAPRSST
jgi:glycosyltransferase involved in cell wall biosynthesis